MSDACCGKPSPRLTTSPPACQGRLTELNSHRWACTLTALPPFAEESTHPTRTCAQGAMGSRRRRSVPFPRTALPERR